MSSRRTLILMATLLLILGAYFAMQLIPTGPSFPSMSSPRVRALAGKDSISGLKVEQTASGAWKAEFNYFYTGAPPDAQLIVETTPAAGSQFLGSPLFDTFPRIPQRGSHHLSIEIRYPGAQGRTVRVTALMRSRLHSSGVVLSRELDQVIDWPDVQTWSIDQLVAARSPEENLKQIQALIDTDGDSQLAFAKQMLG